jgi:membrane-associated protein
VTKATSWPKVVRQMHSLIDLFHKVYNVPGLIRIGGLAAMAAVVFAETGLLVGFFLPGDSLLVTAGVFCTSATPGEAPLLNIVTLCLVLIVAAIAGDTVGYWIGAKAGPKIFTREQSLFFSRKHLLRTREFYERHGGKTIIIARFMPIVRTFAPVVAGVGQMSYRRFLSFNVFGGIGWVTSMTMLGFSLGKIYPQITKQIDKVVILIIFLSLIPGAVSYLSNRKKTPPTASLAA